MAGAIQLPYVYAQLSCGLVMLLDSENEYMEEGEAAGEEVTPRQILPAQAGTVSAQQTEEKWRSRGIIGRKSFFRGW